MKFNSLQILLIILSTIILSCLYTFSVFGQKNQHTTPYSLLPTPNSSDTGLIDALPQKPLVNAKALENALKKTENKKTFSLTITSTTTYKDLLLSIARGSFKFPVR